MDSWQILLGNVPGVLRAHGSQRVLSDGHRKRRPEAPAKELLDVVLPGRGARQHHGWVLALDLRVGVMHGVAISVPSRLADVDKAHEPVSKFVEPARAEGCAVAALMHWRKQAGKDDAVNEHRRKHEQCAVGQIDQKPCAADRGKMTAEVGQSLQIAAAGKLLAGLLVDQPKRIHYHFRTIHGCCLLKALQVLQEAGYKSNWKIREK